MTLRATLILAMAAAAAPALARPFGTGNLIVVQVGDGTAALSSNATACSLLEFTTGGAPVGAPLAMPIVGSGSNRRLTLSGTATSEGFLTLSSDGNYLTMAGYDAATGTASITGSNAATINRVVGRVDFNQLIDTTTVMSESASPGNARSVCSSNGTDFWMTTSGGGVRYMPYGGIASTQLNTAAPTNVRVANIFAGQLYISSASGTFQGVGTLGSGLPTTSGQTPALLPGFPTAAGPSSYDFFFADANTLYVADDRAGASGGGIQKWALSSGTWALQYTISLGTTGGRGLTGYVSGGVTTLYATTTESSANKLMSVTDTGAGSVASTLATAAANTAFRGVEFAPIPSPGVLSLLGLAGIVAARRRR